MHGIIILAIIGIEKHTLVFDSSSLAWWLRPRTPDLEVPGSSPTRVKPCCVLEQGTFTPPKYR